MSVPEFARCRVAELIGALALLALAGCEGVPAPAEGRHVRNSPDAAAPVSTSPPAAPDPGNGLVHSSYEVVIASAAANRKKAMAECATRPEAERETCLAQLEADWEVAKAAADDLRGFAQ
jgi:hypothetical protein